MPKPKKSDMINVLVNTYGKDEKEVSQLKWQQLKEIYDAYINAENTIEAAEDQQESLLSDDVKGVVEDQEPESNKEEAEEEASENIPPRVGTKDWQKYVMSQFDEGELQDGNPTVDALRRVTDILYGPFSVESKIEQTPNESNRWGACVTVNISFGSNQQEKRDSSGSAFVWYKNTEITFARHPVATAETRAEGRALRKALRLTKVLSAEEKPDEDQLEQYTQDEINKKPIPQDLVNSLQVMAKRANVDLESAVKSYGYKIESINDLTQLDGQQVAERIGRYLRKEEEPSDDIKISQ